MENLFIIKINNYAEEILISLNEYKLASELLKLTNIEDIPISLNKIKESLKDKEIPWIFITIEQLEKEPFFQNSFVKKTFSIEDFNKEFNLNLNIIKNENFKTLLNMKRINDLIKLLKRRKSEVNYIERRLEELINN